MQFCLISIFIIAHTVSAANSAVELIKNGSFENDSHWNLAINGDAAGKGATANGIYTISVKNHGTEGWFIQLTQNNLPIKKDFYYTFTLEVSSSIPRTIVTSICKNSDDYLPYSKRDTLTIDTVMKRYEQTFQMLQPSDSTARVEFNLGKYPGDVKIRSISLIEVREPSITFTRIEPRIVVSGDPVKLIWRSLALKGPLKLNISYDNGVSWSVIDSNLSVTDSTSWIAEKILSPWCYFKLSSSTISAISDYSLQIVPNGDNIKNGSFSSKLSHWTINHSQVDSIVKFPSDSGIVLSKNNPADSIKVLILSQKSIQLQEKKSYDLFFTCYSSTQSTVKVVLSSCIHKNPPPVDTAVFVVSEKATRFQVRFISQKTQSDGLLEFHLGAGKNIISFKDISLITLPDTLHSNRITYKTLYNTEFKTNSYITKDISCCHLKYPHATFNLAGRKITSYLSDSNMDRVRKSCGIIIVVPKIHQSIETPDQN